MRWKIMGSEWNPERWEYEYFILGLPCGVTNHAPSVVPREMQNNAFSVVYHKTENHALSVYFQIWRVMHSQWYLMG